MRTMSESKKCISHKFVFETYSPNNEDWEYYITRFEIELSLHNLLTHETEQVRRNILLSKIGSQAFKIIVDYFRPELVTTKTYEDIILVLNEYYCKKKICFV